MPTGHRGEYIAGPHANNRFEWEEARDHGNHSSTWGDVNLRETAEHTHRDYSASIIHHKGDNFVGVNNERIGEDGDLGYGLYKTDKRAKTAAQGMVNRHAEGRDMQTGKKVDRETEIPRTKFRGKRVTDDMLGLED